MKKYFSLLIFVSACVVSLTAQRPENILTEASEPGDSSIFMDDIVQRSTIKDQRVLPYEVLREADIPWQKRIWQVIDVREKINLQFVYPKNPLFKILNDAATQGLIAAFADEDFKKILPPIDVESMMVSFDTVAVVDPETYETTYKPVRNEISAESIKFFRIKEIWYFDREASRLKVRILGIAPVRERIIAGKAEEQPMYWLYYPQIR